MIVGLFWKKKKEIWGSLGVRVRFVTAQGPKVAPGRYFDPVCTSQVHHCLWCGVQNQADLAQAVLKQAGMCLHQTNKHARGLRWCGDTR